MDVVEMYVYKAHPPNNFKPLNGLWLMEKGRM